MQNHRPPAYTLVLAALSAAILLAATVAGLLSLGRFSSPASISTAKRLSTA